MFPVVIFLLGLTVVAAMVVGRCVLDEGPRPGVFAEERCGESRPFGDGPDGQAGALTTVIPTPRTLS